MTQRARMPQRRPCQTVKFKYRDNSYHLTVGYYDNDEPGEVFLNASKVGSDAAALARDGAVLISIALQHDVPVATMLDAITRDQDGTPSTVVGAMLEQLVKVST